jgi:hypothetical protein
LLEETPPGVEFPLSAQPNPADYPREAGYSRIPVMVNCPRCDSLGMTEIEYAHGKASKIWCFLLLPFLCTGACCLCLNSCKDVEHKCGKCHQRVGLNRSACCSYHLPSYF